MINRIVNILLVDDDMLDQIEVSRTLERRNILHKLTIKQNGIEALEYLNDTVTKPDLILLDLNMPKMNGFELLAVMKKHDVFRHIKVFILTVSNDTADKRIAAEMGISGFITKPLKLESPNTSDAFNLMMDLMNA